MLFSTHWSESVCFLKLKREKNPPVYKFELGQIVIVLRVRFENYLFQMVITRKVERLHSFFNNQTEFAASHKRFREILSKVKCKIIQWNKADGN